MISWEWVQYMLSNFRTNSPSVLGSKVKYILSHSIIFCCIKKIRFVLSLIAESLKLGTVDIWGRIILCCEWCPVHCRMFNCISGLHASSKPFSPTNYDNQKCQGYLKNWGKPFKKLKSNHKQHWVVVTLSSVSVEFLCSFPCVRGVSIFLQ